jgi:hypothetical protein
VQKMSKSNVTSSNCTVCQEVIYVQGEDWHRVSGHICLGCGGRSVKAMKFTSKRPVLDKVELLNRGCDCGAKYTTFPGLHSDWCADK